MPVYIDLEDDALARLTEQLGLARGEQPAAALVSAVVPTLRIAARGSVFGLHIGRLIRWAKDDGGAAPPVLAVLALQSMVAERMRRDADFSSSNYYGRFLQTIGCDPADANARGKVVRAFGDESMTMWRALNRWISQDSSTRGIPTAYSFDYRVRVGLPMSQALVRDSDRQAIRAFFGELALIPGQTVSVEDMARLLRAWLPDSYASKSLKLLTHDEDALARVAAVATIELAAWSGVVEEAARRSRRSIALTARLRKLPRRTLRLGAAVSGADGIDTLGIGAEANEAGRMAFAEPVALGAGDGEGWRPVVSELAIADLLVGRARLVADGARAGRDPRTLIVLARDSDTGGFREVDRIRMRTQHLLLAVESARGRVERELVQIARDGWIAHDQMPGLPNGWVLFESVEIIAISDTHAPDLAALIPIVWTELTVAEGFRLPGRAIWHTSAAPEIRASAPPGHSLLLTIVPEPAFVIEELPPADDSLEAHVTTQRIHEVVFEDSVTIDLAALGLDDGDYRVELRDARDPEVMQSTTLVHLRSSESPAQAGAWQLLDYAPRAPRGAISASPILAETAPMGLEGDLGDASEGLAEADAVSDLEPDEIDDPTVPERRATDVPACFTQGAHYFKLESVPHGRHWDRAFDGVCKYCGLEKRFPVRPPGRRRGRAAIGRLRAAPTALAAQARPQAATVDHDLLLDALCQLCAGTGSALERMVSQLDDRPWAAAETARRLIALGHLQVELDGDLRLRRWSIARPRLVESPAGPFLAGWRSPALTYQLGRIVRELGGRVEWTAQDEGPTRVGVLGVDEEDLPGLAEELGRRCELSVALERDPGGALAAELPSVTELREQLPVIASMPIGAALQRLDSERLQWVSVSAITVPGAYRTTSWPRLRLHFNGIDLRRADSRLAKWLTWPRPPMLTIDEANRSVCCHLGSEPPGLYERALVIGSGMLPRRFAEHLVRYDDVSPITARALAQLLEPVTVTS
jgi:hypothetical protein